MKTSDINMFWIVMGISASGLIIYFYLVSLLQKSSKKKAFASGDNEMLVYTQRLSGVITFGVLPYVTIYWAHSVTGNYGLILLQPLRSLAWFMVLATIIVPLCVYWGKTPANLKVYPQIRSGNWTIKTLVFSALSWAAYLFCYEFFFRGFMLFACDRALGPHLAVMVNVLVYALAHLPKGKVETLGAIPLGLVLCLVTLSTGTIWPAFGAHLTMALTNEWASIYYHDSMKVVLKHQERIFET